MNKSKQADIDNPSSPYYKNLDAAGAISVGIVTYVNDITTAENLTPALKEMYDDCIVFVQSPIEAMKCVLVHEQGMRLEGESRDIYDQYIAIAFLPTEAMKCVFAHEQGMRLEGESREIYDECRKHRYGPIKALQQALNGNTQDIEVGI